MDTFTIIVLCICLGLTLAMVAVSLLLRGRAAAEDRYSGATRFLLVALRLAIGWHFFIEAAEKLHTPTWSGEGYLRESYGPFRHTFRNIAGDRLVDQLSVTADMTGLPEALAVDVDAYASAFAGHYVLTNEQQIKAQAKLDQARSKLRTWLTASTKAVTKISAFPPPLVLEMTIAERLAELVRLQAEMEKIEDELIPVKGEEAWPKWRAAKANYNKWRNELKRDLEGQFAEYKKDVQTVLTSEQRELLPLREPVSRPLSSWTMLDWSDFSVKYGLLAVGIGLLVGLFTRTFCILGGLYLLTFFLAMPPLPGWPEPARVEGHYLFINKSVIEMLALFALATTRSGRWAGLDGLVQFLRPSAWRKAPPPVRVDVAVSPPVATPVDASFSPGS